MPSFRDGPKDQTRNLEIPRCAIAHLWFDASHRPGMTIAFCAIVTCSKNSAAARAAPGHRDQFALARQRDVGGLETRPAESDVGGDAVAGRHLLNDRTVGCDHGN